MKRILGEISNEVVEQWELQDHNDKRIVMHPEAKEHSKDRQIDDYPVEDTKIENRKKKEEQTKLYNKYVRETK